MGNAIDIGALADTIKNELASYTVDVAEKVKKASDEVTKELLDATKADAPKRTGSNGGAYQKAMKVKTTKENDYEKFNRWYVDPKTGEYRLSHLLEYGHKIFKGTAKGKKGQTQIHKKGGRVRAFPHIKKNEEIAKEKFAERVKQAINNAK